MRFFLSFLLLVASSHAFGSDRQHHLIVTHLHSQFVHGNFWAVENNRRIANEVKKKEGYITVLTAGPPTLLDFSDRYPKLVVKKTWIAEFAGLATKPFKESLDQIDLTITGFYFNKCQTNAILSAIADMAEEGIEKITVHVPMPATLIKPKSKLADLGRGAKWTRKDVIAAVKAHYLIDGYLDEKIQEIKTAETRVLVGAPASSDPMIRMFLKKENINPNPDTVIERDPSKIRDYRVHLFVDGYKYETDEDVLQETTWKNSLDDGPVIRIVFWSFLDKYLSEVLDVEEEELSVPPVHQEALPKLTPHSLSQLEHYCSSEGLGGHYNLVNNILIAQTEDSDHHVLASIDDSWYLHRHRNDRLVQTNSTYIFDLGLETPWEPQTVRIEMETRRGVHLLYATGQDGNKLFYHQPIGHCADHSFISYLSMY